MREEGKKISEEKEGRRKRKRERCQGQQGMRRDKKEG